MRALTLRDVIAEHRRSYPQGIALVDGPVRSTWADLDDRIAHLARALAAEGIGHGDRVMWIGQNSFRLLELLVAAGEVGAMLCPANWRLSPDELAFVFDDLEPQMVVWQHAELGETVATLRANVDAGRARWVCHDDDGPDGYDAFLVRGRRGADGTTTASTAVARDAADHAGSADDPVLIIYTAAFDGRPNGAMLSHSNLLAQALVIGYLFDLGADYSYLCSGPLFHIGAVMWMSAVVAFGGRVVMIARVDAEEICRLIEQERCNGAFLVPPTIAQIVELNRDGRFDLSSLRVGQYQELWNGMVATGTTRAARRPGGYGQTEVTGLVTWSAIGAPGGGGHGRPSPLTQVRVVDPDGAEVPAGEVGELVVRGALAGHGYWRRPELNAHRTRGGWWHTGDLGRRDDDGSLTFVGTMTRMIKSGVENIYPQEVEACLRTHHAVRDAAVIGVPEPRFVQSVKAIVVVEPGESVTAVDLIDHCRRRLASYKKPRYVEFTDDLPRGPAGVDYDALDRAFGGGNYPGGDTAITG